VRGVLDANGRALNRYDMDPKPAQPGDAIAARLVTYALQQAVASGTGRQLIGDGLGRLQPAGKTGTSNDSRDSWFAGWTGDHLAVIWVGNDQNAPTGLYGATGAMRVWSGLFSRLPSAPLRVGGQGVEWQWVSGDHSTDPGCPGARQLAFVAGFAPPYQPCLLAEPDPEAQAEGEAEGFWRRIFGLGDDGGSGSGDEEAARREQQEREEREQQRQRDEQEEQRRREQQASEDARDRREREQRFAELRARDEAHRERLREEQAWREAREREYRERREREDAYRREQDIREQDIREQERREREQRGGGLGPQSRPLVEVA
jgi:membrane peptidoglycan carboxypeptidase